MAVMRRPGADDVQVNDIPGFHSVTSHRARRSFGWST